MKTSIQSLSLPTFIVEKKDWEILIMLFTKKKTKQANTPPSDQTDWKIYEGELGATNFLGKFQFHF